ncbi:hypothetical protein EA76_00335 [Enterococcus faecalis]|nr:hypothetical protein EA76_00335 [Enterococcus faecalis]
MLSIVFNELTSSGSMGSAIAADFYVLTNTINDTVSIKTSAVDANGVSIGTGSNGVGTYYPTNSGSFLPFITAKDATVYTTDAPIDLLGLAEAYDQIDGDITDNIKIINNGGFDQSKPGEYKINYQVINSKGESAEYTNLVTVKENKSSIKGHDSTIYVGEKWTASDNFDSALDKDGNEIDFSKITVSGEVDTTKPGEYPITYSYEGISTTITVTVKEKKHDNESIIIVQYVDEKGNKIADDTIIRGKIGDKYETKAKKIDGYILKEEPENKNGKFVNTLTNIKYIYTNRSDATDKNKDIDTNKKIFKNEKLHSSKTYKTLPKTNEDYSVGSTILGVVILLGTTFVWFFRSKK